MVYNRSPGPADALRALGASVADTSAQLFASCDAIILMLADDAAVDAILARRESDFGARAQGRLIINMGTHSPEFSLALSNDIVAAGGSFVEAPVSGSRGPAESGELVAMLAGKANAIAQARALLGSMCSTTVVAGAVPTALAMKLAVNLYLIASVTALAEAAHLARLSDVNLDQFAEVIGSGALGSAVARAKLDKIRRDDFSPQAAIADVVKNARLVEGLAAKVRAQAPLLKESRMRFESVAAAGLGGLDMAAVYASYAPGTVPE
ncbi:2-hydroxy-3-oxopropionate reductase [Altererythrobacter sp. B11]|nr:2-hydroxy-3-oxopropionate reductase [Altererythrobacter sp. B11]